VERGICPIATPYSHELLRNQDCHTTGPTGDDDDNGRTAAAEKHPLSCYVPQSVHGHSYCSARNFPLTMHYGGKKLGENRGRDGRILTHNERFLTFGVPAYGVKFHQN